MIDSTTNTTLAALADELLKAQDIVIAGHVNPDGDCLGSQLALFQMLRLLGKDVTVVLAHDDPLPRELCFLPGAEAFVPARALPGAIELFMAVDAGVPERIGDADELRQRAKRTITLDHHGVACGMSDLNYSDPDAAATALLVWDLIKLLPLEPSAEAATCTLTGLITDTGSFRYQNADARAFEAAAEMVHTGAEPAEVAKNLYQNNSLASLLLERAAIEHLRLLDDGTIGLSWVSMQDMQDCHAQRSDAENLVNVVRSIAGVRVACVLRDRGSEVRGSLRAKDATDVSALARALGGGGHRAAAGFTIKKGLPEAIEFIEQELLRFFSGDMSGERS